MNITSKSLISLALFILVIVVLFFGISPMWNKFKTAQETESAAKEKQQQLTSQEAEIEKFLKQFKDDQKYVVETDAALPVKGAALESVLANLDEMAKNSGLALMDSVFADKTDVDKKNAKNTVQTEEVSVVAAGTFPAFKNFLILLENNLRIMDIKEVTFEVQQNGTSEFRATFTTYYQK